MPMHVKSRLHVGDQWGCISVVDVRATPAEIEGVYDSEGGPLIYTFRCDCGRTIELAEGEFQSRRQFRACGADECEYSQAMFGEEWDAGGQLVGELLGIEEHVKEKAGRARGGRKRAMERAVMLTVYAPVRSIAIVERYALARRVSKGRALGELADLAMEWLEEHGRVDLASGKVKASGQTSGVSG